MAINITCAILVAFICVFASIKLIPIISKYAKTTAVSLKKKPGYMPGLGKRVGAIMGLIGMILITIGLILSMFVAMSNPITYLFFGIGLIIFIIAYLDQHWIYHTTEPKIEQPKGFIL